MQHYNREPIIIMTAFVNLQNFIKLEYYINRQLLHSKFDCNRTTLQNFASTFHCLEAPQVSALVAKFTGKLTQRVHNKHSLAEQINTREQIN